MVTRLHLENKSSAKNKKKYEFTILLLVIFQLAQVVLCNVIGDFEFANDWAFEMVISPL